ncbi:MAG: sigma-70 family RNA polymerase sigma factor [Planctomycetales bacterium]|nr:sigma-70 family RNA polymerase sigma factor [Planctomycetales bacterium]
MARELLPAAARPTRRDIAQTFDFLAAWRRSRRRAVEICFFRFSESHFGFATRYLVLVGSEPRRAGCRNHLDAAGQARDFRGMAVTEAHNESREQEFLRLFAAAQRPLHAYIMAWVFDPNVAADLLQETNIVLWQKFDHFQSGTNFLAWAREIARRSILRHRQINSGRMAMLPPEMMETLACDFSAPAAMDQHDQRRAALDGCLQKLTGPDRSLVMSRYAPGASVMEIAGQLNRTVNSVSQSLRRIRRALTECMQRSMRTEEEPV